MELLNNSLKYFKGNSFSYIFNPLNGTSIVVENNIAEKIKKGEFSNSPEITSKLSQRGISDKDNTSTIKKQIKPVSFMIDFTKACQNRCIYCFRNLNQQEFITQDNLSQILDYIIDYCNNNSIKNIALQPWGGEPTLAWDKIKYTQDYLIEHNITPQINIETNAISITPYIAKEMFNRDIAISVSIDGPKDIHNQHRPLYKSIGSFDKTIKGFNILQDAGYGSRLGIVCVITKNSVLNLDRIVDFFVSNLRVQRVKMNTIRDSVNLTQKNISLNENDILHFCKTLCDLLISIAQTGYSFSESGIVERLHNLLDLKPTSLCCSRGCQGYYRIYSFDSLGSIYPCDLVDSPEFVIGNVQEKKSFSQMVERCKNKFYRYKYDIEHCNKCEYHFFCKGGCTAMNIFNNASIDKHECTRNKYLYNRLINIILEQPDIISLITNNEITII
ncbi:MAG: radical SAM protein [Muribaculaceae bacterium]|nr:radical SAM protein [Muribaculaceae bacterium]